MALERSSHEEEMESMFGEVPHVTFSPFYGNHGHVNACGDYGGLAWNGDAMHDYERVHGGYGICDDGYEMGLSEKMRKIVIDDGSGVENGVGKDGCFSLSNFFDREDCSIFGVRDLFDKEKLMRMKLQEQFQIGKLSGVSRLNGGQFYEDLLLDSHKKLCFSQGNRVSNVMPSIERSSTFAEPFIQAPQIVGSCFGDGGRFCSFSSAPTGIQKPTLGVTTKGYLQCGLPINQIGCSSQNPTPTRNEQCFSSLTREDTYILEGKELRCMLYNNSKKSAYHSHFEREALDKNFELTSRGHVPKAREVRILEAKDYPLLDIRGYVYHNAKDQTGCRILQESLDLANPQLTEIIFTETINHIVELMMDQFGNYLVQKLLDVCNEGQVTQILLVVTAKPGDLVKISLNTHGTRAVQKLIASVRNQQQTSLVVSALEQGFLDLAKDLNGNHVLQCCLQYLNRETNKFIFSSAVKYCVNIATHRQGCCVIQRCIYHSSGEHREKLVANICTNGLLLSQDSFGNYVVQYIIELRIPSTMVALSSQFEGNYVHLSTQKFSSFVVQKCLQYFGKDDQLMIINELLSASQLNKLLQDQYANYVFQHALKISKGTSLHALLVEAILPHEPFLRNSPHCKKLLAAANIRGQVQGFSRSSC